jgi:hypothetical protein
MASRVTGGASSGATAATASAKIGDGRLGLAPTHIEASPLVEAARATPAGTLAPPYATDPDQSGMNISKKVWTR